MANLMECNGAYYNSKPGNESIEVIVGKNN